MKKIVLWIGLLGIFASSVGNYLYYEYKKLEVPVLLDHYYSHTFRKNKEISFIFYYLTNKEEPLAINFIEANGVVAYATNRNPILNENGDLIVHPVRRYSHQYLLAEEITFRYDSIPFDTNGTWSFREAKVHFSNGDIAKANFGKVFLRKELKDGDEADALQITMSQSSSDGTGKTSGETTVPLNIEKIYMPLNEEVGHFIELKINADQEYVFNGRGNDAGKGKGEALQTDFFPIQLPEHQKLEVAWKIDSGNTSFLELEVDLAGTTENGEPFLHHMMIAQDTFPDQTTVNRIIKEKGGDRR